MRAQQGARDEQEEWDRVSVGSVTEIDDWALVGAPRCLQLYRAFAGFWPTQFHTHSCSDRHQLTQTPPLVSLPRADSSSPSGWDHIAELDASNSFRDGAFRAPTTPTHPPARTKPRNHVRQTAGSRAQVAGHAPYAIRNAQHAACSSHMQQATGVSHITLQQEQPALWRQLAHTTQL